LLHLNLIQNGLLTLSVPYFRMCTIC